MEIWSHRRRNLDPTIYRISQPSDYSHNKHQCTSRLHDGLSYLWFCFLLALRSACVASSPSLSFAYIWGAGPSIREYAHFLQDLRRLKKNYSGVYHKVSHPWHFFARLSFGVGHLMIFTMVEARGLRRVGQFHWLGWLEKGWDRWVHGGTLYGSTVLPLTTSIWLELQKRYQFVPYRDNLDYGTFI